MDGKEVTGGHHFISYSRRQSKAFAADLRGALLLESPSVRVWLDTRDIKPGRDWDEEIVEAIRNCDSLMFVMTPDSVRSKSVCKKEWARALKYKKPIVPLLLDRKAEMPFRLEGREYIDFTGDFDVGLERLYQHLQWLASPEGELQVLKDRLEDDERDLEVATDPDQQKRIRKEIDELERQIARQQRVVKNPREAEEQVQGNIESGKAREREPETLCA
jgi:TIR domain